MKRDETLFLDDILNSINAIEEFSKNINKKELVSNRLKQSAIIREIEIIGEAAKNISKAIKNKYPSISWKEIIGTRDVIIHAYFGIDFDAILDIIKKDLPELKIKILKIKGDLK